MNVEPTLITAAPSDGDDNTKVPHISLAFYVCQDDPDDVEMFVGTLEYPTDAPASNALLTGLAILALERQGYVARCIEKMFPHGRPTEREATQHVGLLFREEANALAA